MSHIFRSSAVLALVSTGALATVVAAGTAASAAPGARAARSMAAAPAASQKAAAVPGGTRLWVARFDGRTHRTAFATSVAASPDGAVVYVTGFMVHVPTFPRGVEVTAAYNATTGARLWLARYRNEHPHPFGEASSGIPSVTVSPNGSRVFVAGEFRNFGGTSVVAYNAGTGALLWATGASGNVAPFRPVAVSPDGAQVFVTGTLNTSLRHTYVTTALDAATGGPLWETVTSTKGFGGHAVTSIAVSPDGSEVFVGGSSGLIAYATANGATLWFDEFWAKWGRYPDSLAVSPSGSTVFLTSGSSFPGKFRNYRTVAYNATTGAKVWAASYLGPAAGDGTSATAIAISPDGSKVFVTGSSTAAHGLLDYATVGYDAATGATLWAARYDGPANSTNDAVAIAVSPDGSKVFVTGSSTAAQGLPRYATVGYDAVTGATLWVARYGPANAGSSAAGVAVSATGANVVVTGSSGPSGGPSEFATVGYQG